MSLVVPSGGIEPPTLPIEVACSVSIGLEARVLLRLGVAGIEWRHENGDAEPRKYYGFCEK